MFKSLNDSIYKILVNIFNEKDKNSIIEPLICLVRLAILEFKPIGTKISIFNNKITYNEPNILQGAVRWSNGDARDDLHNIFLPINKAYIWYDVNKEDIKNIFKFSIRGLEKLKKSYSKNSTINHSIQYYIDTLKGSLVNTELHIESRTNRKNKLRDNSDEPEDAHNTIFNKLKGIWNDREISIINNLLIEMDSRRGTTDHPVLDNEDSDSIILTLETLLSSKENRVSDLIIRSTTLLE
jgi:hypothetical protein